MNRIYALKIEMIKIIFIFSRIAAWNELITKCNYL